MVLRKEDIEIINNYMESISIFDRQINNFNKMAEQIAINDCGIELSIDIVNFDEPIVVEELPRPPQPPPYIKLPPEMNVTNSSLYMMKIPPQLEEEIRKVNKFKTEFIELSIGVRMALRMLKMLVKDKQKEKIKLIRFLNKKYQIELIEE